MIRITLREITWRIAAAGLLSLVALPGLAATQVPQPGSITQAEWHTYVSHFVTEGGRVVDDANGNISHSESQGYGLLLAYLSKDQATFDQIWSFTETNMWLRDDGLVAWKWDPATRPHIQDINNASDGDVLIAYSLALAAKKWNRSDLGDAALRIATAIATKLVFKTDEQWIITPAVTGFDSKDAEDGPVINLSYWIFEAFPVLAEMTKQGDLNKLTHSGVDLIQEARFGPDMLPSDWISLHDGMKPASGFPTEFSYNSFRIPLYLMRSGHESTELLKPFLNAMGSSKDGVQVINVNTGARSKPLNDLGYAAIGAALECVLEGKPLPEEITTFKPTSYYPSTLHLLVLSFITEQHPVCR
ncbi:glycosyl hydrolase family 8 [Roseibium algae]|uniref:cellulase n=1 Tax=Roseibium algae TaxID=3123038 RepID=A0ABU8TI10_9HYPH